MERPEQLSNPHQAPNPVPTMVPQQGDRTLMVFTRLAVLLATSLADWTNWRLATGLAVREEARRHVLHRAEVCFATMVAADSTCREEQGKAGSTMTPHPRSSPFPPAPHGAPVTTGVPLVTQERLPRSCMPMQPPIWTVTLAPKLPADSQYSQWGQMRH